MGILQQSPWPMKCGLTIDQYTQLWGSNQDQGIAYTILEDDGGGNASRNHPSTASPGRGRGRGRSGGRGRGRGSHTPREREESVNVNTEEHLETNLEETEDA
mmetsp:Transcript_5660/g.8191  ORF Transcript_5660/g.8191 Transcript_5660/m.8191 type:complete len:102 (-) Transcript_5660:9-314(-)